MSRASTSDKFSYAILAARYLAVQELREKVRQAEQRFASIRLKKLPIMRPASAMNAKVHRKDQRSWPAGSAIR